MTTQTVTLLTDWGNSDHYAAVVKARLQAKIPKVRVVDISHAVPRDDIYAAAYIALDSYPYFPEGTIHIVGVNDIASKDNAHLVVRFGHQFIIGADNGFFTVLQLLAERTIKEIYEIGVWQETSVYTFPARDLFPRVASLLATGRPLEQIGTSVAFSDKLLDGGGIPVQKSSEKDRNGNETAIHLTGRVMCIDGFGNIITNITKKQFASCLVKYDFAELRVDMRIIQGKFVNAYKDVEVATPAFIFLDNGFLEISMNLDNAFERLGVKRGAKVILRFVPKK